MYRRKWKPRTPDTDVFHRLLESDRTRSTILALWDQLFEADAECHAIEEFYLKELEKREERVAELEARFLKDPLNSHKPSSSEPFKKPQRTRSLREKTGQAPGGQPGHEGKTLDQRPDAHETRIRPVYQCGRCGHRLKSLPVTSTEIRQIIDLKDGKPYVVEYRGEMKICPNCDSMNHGGFPEEARAYVCYGPGLKRMALYFACQQLIPVKRTQEILKHLYGLSPSPGSLVNWVIESGKRLKGWENEAKREIIHSEVAGFDETGVRCMGTLQWLHVHSTQTHTLLVPHPKRGSEATDAIGVLPDFHGTAVHDGWSSYFNYGCAHALCNAHHLRELNFVYELEEESWALEMKKLLQQGLHHLHQCEARGNAIRKPWIRSIEKRYDKILRKGYRAYRKTMPKVPAPPRAGPKEKRDTGHNLLHRLHYFKRETLAFLRDPSVPFTNNASERDLRMAKVKQKVSGCFRSFGGALAFFRIRSFLCTAQKQDKNPLEALCEILPPIPALQS